MSFTIRNCHGFEVTAVEHGARITSIKSLDQNGVIQNIILTYADEAQSKNDPFYRYAGRISDGQFEINGKSFTLQKNESGMNHLHGGLNGWNQKKWKCIHHDASSMEFELVSPDLDEGYPGEVTVKVQYQLSNEDRLKINYTATTTKATHLNLTQHTYFNLSGNPEQTINDHELSINAHLYLLRRPDQIPTGENGDGKISAQIIGAEFMDQSWILAGDQKNLVHAATLTHHQSGRVLTVFTTEPSVHVYTGDGLASPFIKRAGICLETQHYPDSPHHPHFPSTLLSPNEIFNSETVWEFSLLNQDHQ